MSLILQPTPDVREETILVGTTIRKPPEIVQAYLQHLAAQRPIPGVRVRYAFQVDTDDPVVRALVQGFVQEHGGTVECHDPEGPLDFDDSNPQTHQWTPTAMARVGRLKDRILAQARQEQVAAVWLCDADLLCDPGTLRSLWYADTPITCAVYWTRWQNTDRAAASPQVWLRHPYNLTGNGYPDEASFRARLLTRQLTRVWGQGACTLIRRRALEKQVSFAYLDGVSREGMMAGEDRHFCLRAEALHLPMVADPWPHIFHVYHPQDRDAIPAWTERLASLRVAPPAWLNVQVRLLEPVPTGPNQQSQMPAVTARVRVGAGQMLPELEAACLDHLDGQPFTTAVHFPIHYPLPFLRGQRRLVEAVVVDVKDATGMPVLETEMHREADLVAYTPQQVEVMRG